MKLDVVFLPGMLKEGAVSGRTVVVFDVLRATTTMAAALAAGVREIRIFGDLGAVVAAGKACAIPHLICGERQAIRPEGFDLGNSPGALNSQAHRGQTLLMSTTNGTRAILAARGAKVMFVGALVNASAVAGALVQTDLDVTLLCSGTEGEISLEDVLGAGAVIDAVRAHVDVELISDSAQVADGLFQAKRHDLFGALTGSRGGRNIKRANLSPDIEFCATLDLLSVVGVVRGDDPVVRRWEHS